MTNQLRLGQIWIENDTRFVRYVRILVIEDGKVTTVTCDENGNPVPRCTKHAVSKVARFNGKTRGFSLFKEGNL